jgi:hypothetical protein
MRFLFDENFAPRLVRSLNCLIESEGDTARALVDKFPAGTPDETYLKELSEEGDWVVLTQDMGIVLSPPLVAAWRSAGLIVVIFKSGWNSLTFWDKAWKITKFWPELRKCVQVARPGSVVAMTVNGRPKALPTP